MKQLMVQMNDAISIHRDTCVERMGINRLSSATIIRAVAPKGHEGHVMPMPSKPPAVKPSNEKIKPKVPSTPPVAKPPAKHAAMR